MDWGDLTPAEIRRVRRVWRRMRWHRILNSWKHFLGING